MEKYEDRHELITTTKDHIQFKSTLKNSIKIKVKEQARS